jgi:hypothetical protein
MEPGREYVVLASYLSLKRLVSTPRFLRDVWVIRRQLAGADGLVGYTLRAQPWTRDYWTLSVWQDGEALGRFVTARPHAQVMVSLRPLMGATKFHQWTINAADGMPTLTTAVIRLTAA